MIAIKSWGPRSRLMMLLASGGGSWVSERLDACQAKRMIRPRDAPAPSEVSRGLDSRHHVGAGNRLHREGPGPDVQIAQLECTGDPELVVIENLGDSAQALDGWELQSDPPDSEVFDLRDLGTIPGAGGVGLHPERAVRQRGVPVGRWRVRLP